MSSGATIFALSSGSGRAAVAVIRISGQAAGKVIDAIAPPRPRKRMAVLRRLKHPETGAALDDALVFWSAAPKSETGEDVAEFQVHGGRAVVRAVLEALSRIPGCRPAEPGEFARRAFENGKLDLAQAEGLADLIEAETEAQRRQALSQAGGATSKLYEGWRSKLVNAAALVEAAIDFSDEADVASDAVGLARRMIEGLSVEIGRHLDDEHRGEILREGYQVVLAGPPNVGKSSLLNCLARRDVAIVSAEAGTTRDLLEVRLDLAGLPVVVSDTAGIREAEGDVEREGIRRALSRAREADLLVWLTAPDDPAAVPPEAIRPSGSGVLRVLNKADLLGPGAQGGSTGGGLPISALTGAGVGQLTTRIGELAASRLGPCDEPVVTQVRHRALLDACAKHLAAFLDGAEQHVELRAEDLRQAANALGRITGQVGAEDVLDQVFKRFCIGK